MQQTVVVETVVIDWTWPILGGGALLLALAVVGLAVVLVLNRRARLQHLSRVILKVYQGKEQTGRLALETQEGKSGEVLCHFQLTPTLTKGSVLELFCPKPNMPNGVAYEIDLSAYVAQDEP